MRGKDRGGWIFFLFVMALLVSLRNITVQFNLFDNEYHSNIATHQPDSSSPIITSQHPNIDQDDKIAALALHRATRDAKFLTWYAPGQGTDRLNKDADANGTILDFIIAGFPKTGTTTLEDNLGFLAPMPRNTDVCTPPAPTVYYAYRNWPNKYPDPQGRNDTKRLRGTKCPAHISDLRHWSLHLPSALAIVGIRHPVLWFQSFWNHQALVHPGKYVKESPYDYTSPCSPHQQCPRDCPNQLICVHRARFHVTLARMGKTALGAVERALLAPNDFDGGDNIANHSIRNPIFLYEQTQLQDDDWWETLSIQLHYNGTIAHNQTSNTHAQHLKRSKQHNAMINICDAKYDALRQQLMPYAAEMAHWVCDYFVHAADVTVHGGFCDIVRQYDLDPCGRLVWLANGTYVLGTSNVTSQYRVNDTIR